MKLLQLVMILLLIVGLTHEILAQNLAGKVYKYSYPMDEEYEQVFDPFEKLNRKIFTLNAKLDHLLLRPLAIFYKKTTNNYFKARVSGVIDNLGAPLTIVNCGLQMKFNSAILSVWRFIINTTFGIGGLFDIASKVDLNPTRQTFGGTFASYGIKPGPYLVIPIFGGTSARDVVDILSINNPLHPLKYKLPSRVRSTFIILKTVNDRTTMLPFTDYVTSSSTDQYIAVRSAIYQYHESLVEYQ